MSALPADLLLPQGIPGLELRPGERVLASLRPDLDEHLRFAAGLVVLTSTRLHVSFGAGDMHGFELSPSLTLRKSLGHPKAHAPARRVRTLTSWSPHAKLIMPRKYPLT